MHKFLNRLVRLYLNSGHAITGTIISFSEDYLELIDLTEAEIMIFRPLEHIIMVRIIEKEEIENTLPPDPELPSPELNLQAPNPLQEIVRTRVSQVQEHHKAIGQFLNRTKAPTASFAPAVKYEYPNFQK